LRLGQKVLGVTILIFDIDFRYQYRMRRREFIGFWSGLKASVRVGNRQELRALAFSRPAWWRRGDLSSPDHQASSELVMAPLRRTDGRGF